MASDRTAFRILLIIGGGIAAYKCLELIRRLAEDDVQVRAVLTKAAEQFVTPLSVAALTRDKVYQDLFSLTDEAEMGHIRLSRDADLVVVAPATADLMAKIAGGHADDLASTALLATDKPVLIAPAMNPEMWARKATMRNVERLRADGILFVGPEPGDMACGEVGLGRMAEPDAIRGAILKALAPRPRVLSGLRVLVTSGPTHEPIDPVRYLANRSSGKQGHAIAEACLAAGAEVVLVSGPVSLTDPVGAMTRHIETAREMAAACAEALPVDVAICAAAVADWRPATEAAGKLKKTGDQAAAIELAENPDILAALSKSGPNRPRLVIGFAAETDDVVEHAKAKLSRKGCDWILANDVSPQSGVFGGDRNRVLKIDRQGLVETWPDLHKTEVARRLVEAIAGELMLSEPKAAAE